MRLTNLELYKYAQEKYDKANTPNVSQRNFVLFYTEARSDWLALIDKDYELTEKRRSDFRGFILPQTFSGDTKVLGDEVLYIKAMLTSFATSCDSVPKVPVQPRSWDEVTESLRNPFTCPNDEEPVYVEYDNKVEIYSTTVPTLTKFIYVKRPKAFDLIGDPGGFTDENREQQEMILDIAVAKIKLKFSQQFGYEAIKNAEIPMNE